MSVSDRIKWAAKTAIAVAGSVGAYAATMYAVFSDHVVTDAEVGMLVTEGIILIGTCVGVFMKKNQDPPA